MSERCELLEYIYKALHRYHTILGNQRKLQHKSTMREVIVYQLLLFSNQKISYNFDK